jgi:polar amino acid transport system substrate-binding protein
VIVLRNKKLSNKKAKNKRLNHFTLLMAFLVGISVPHIGYAAALKVCYDQWPPMTIFPSEGDSERGVVIDMLEQIYSSKGYQLEYYEVPLARGLDMVKEGLCDVLPEYLYSKNPDDHFVYADEETFAYTTAFVVRRDDPWRYNGIQSLKGKRIATGPGWDYSSMSAGYQDYIDDPKNSNLVEIVAGYDDVVDRIFQMISENRVDLYADNDLVLQYVLNRLNLNDDLRIVRPGLENKLVEMPIFSKNIPTEKRQDLVKIWNEGRLAMKGEKEQVLLNKYKVSLAK